MKLSELHDLNYCCTIKEEHPGKIGEMVNSATFYNVIKPILRLCFNFVKQLVCGSKISNVPDDIETVIIICTLNQLRALEGLVKNIPNSLVISIFPVKCKHNVVVDVTGNCFGSFLHLPRLIFGLLREKGFRKKAMIYHFDDFLNTPGVYNHAKKYLKAINPKSVIMANDHTFFPRSYFRTAQKEGINTIYTQHASVSAYFPDLEFDYAFLDGQETFDKYTGNGRKFKSNVFFSGSPRFDKIPLIEKNNIFDLGIAINILDEQENIIKFIEAMPTDKIRLAVRPHPALQNKSFWEEFCYSNSIGYSNPLNEVPTTFISNCKCFVAGDSAFHLEVALSEKVSYFLNFQNEDATDWYEFIKNGLVSIKTKDEIVTILNNNIQDEISREKVKYYVANFETNYWGKSIQLLERAISDINTDKSFCHWQRTKEESKIFEIKA
jgi:hypothetical protein